MRNILNYIIPIWVITAIAALIILLTQQITLHQAINSIDTDILLYLFGIFLISQAIEISGYLEFLAEKIFLHAHTGKEALVIIIFISGFSSALLLNDTIAIVGTSVILQLCRINKQLTKPLLLGLAYAITTGSTMSPIGNPQNLLIAAKAGMPTPFISFTKYLFIPTILNLIIVYFSILLAYQPYLIKPIYKLTNIKNHDPQLSRLTQISLIFFILMIFSKIIFEIYHLPFQIRFHYIALIAALPLCLSPRIFELFKKLDWGILLFFISTFILIQSVWDTGFLQEKITQLNFSITHPLNIIILSVIVSQFISNVPLVTLYLPLLIHHNIPETHFLALAIGSTIAGNSSIFGAASNVIIIQSTEHKNEISFGFLEFLKIGVPLTLIQLITYYLFL